MKKKIALIVLFILFGPTIPKSYCAYNYSNQRDYIAIASYYTHLSDMGSTNNPTQSIAPIIEIEAGLRFRDLFQFIIVNAKSTSSSAENNRESVGLGLRIDTPGIFWIGEGHRQKSRAVKNFPINTSVFAYSLRSSIKSSTGSTSTVTGSNMGLTLDVFLFNEFIYFSTQGSILNEQGNTYSSYSFGLGANF